MLVSSFSPVIPVQPTVLILGSMPGLRSLQQNQYYAHPQNSFWKIMGVVCGAGLDCEYEQRLLNLKTAGIALWDVLQYCERNGSLDTNIIVSTEVPNNLPGLLDRHSSIKAIAFNGKKAEQAFNRHVKPLLDEKLYQQLDLIVLPSTSPANAMKTHDAKLQEWKYLLRYLSTAPAA